MNLRAPSARDPDRNVADPDDRLAAISTLLLRCCEPDAEKAGGRDGTEETPVEM